jgi:two-component system response regulator MprA
MEFLKDYDMPVPEEIKKDFRPKILVVDDDRAVIKNVEKMLKAKIEGVEIATAGDGFEACIIAGHWTPDLIILDLIMPNMNGIEVIRSLKSSALTRNVSILVYSGFLDDNMINNLKEQGVKHFLHKPEKLSEMMKMVVTILTPA